MAIEKKSAYEIARELSGREPIKSGDGYKVSCPVPGHEDTHPSCTVSNTAKGWIHIECHSRCGAELPKAELIARGLVPDFEKIKQAKAEREAKAAAKAGPVDGRWEYIDINGVTQLIVTRTNTYDSAGKITGKSFNQRTLRSGKPSLDKEYEPCPLRVREFKAGAERGAVLFDVEGEGKVDVLVEREFIATCTPQGSKSIKLWLRCNPPEYAKGCMFVAVLEDNDEVGRKFAEQKCFYYHKAGVPVKLIALPGLGQRTKDHGLDIKDWFLIEGNDNQKLKDIVIAAPLWEPSEDIPEPAKIEEEKSNVIEMFKANQDRCLTETFAAEVFLKERPNDLLYIRDDKTVMLWDGIRYRPDPNAEDSWLAVQKCNDLILPGALKNEKVEAKDRTRHLKQMLDKSKINNVLAIILKHSGTYYAEIDQNPDLLCVLNGVVNLRTGELMQPHDRKYRMTKLAPFNFNLKAKCPRYKEFQKRIFDGDEEMIAFNKRWRGYGLTGRVGAQKVRINKGSGANGKSVDMNLARRIGGDNAISVKARMFMRKQDSAENQLDSFVQLVGKRACYVGEIKQSDVLDDAKIKEVSGGDECQYRVYFKTEPNSFFPQAKLEFRTNYKPGTTTDDALWRRLMVVEYGVVLPDDQKIEDFDQLLFEHEADGIGSDYVLGAIDQYEYGLMIPGDVTTQSKRYRDEEDLPHQFVTQWCQAWGVTPANEIHRYYRRWSKAEGYDKVMSPKTLKKELERLGFKADPADPTLISGISIKPKISFDNHQGEDHDD